MFADAQDLKLAMNPTMSQELDKDAVSHCLAARAHVYGGTYPAIKNKAMEVLQMLPADLLMPDPLPAPEATTKKGKTSGSAGGYAALLRSGYYIRGDKYNVFHVFVHIYCQCSRRNLQVTWLIAIELVFVTVIIVWLCRVILAPNMLPPDRTAQSIGLLTGEVGVEYIYGDSAICARVHSIEESVRTVSTRRPNQAFDKHSLFVYGDTNKKVNFATWTTKILGDDAVSWRKRTSWFTDDLIRRSLLKEKSFKEFVLACPTKEMVAAAKARVRSITGPMRSVHPASPTQSPTIDDMLSYYE